MNSYVIPANYFTVQQIYTVLLRKQRHLFKLGEFTLIQDNFEKGFIETPPVRKNILEKFHKVKQDQEAA